MTILSRLKAWMEIKKEAAGQSMKAEFFWASASLLLPLPVNI
jgi:hypothetical protein